MTDAQFDKLLDVLDRNFSAIEQHLMTIVSAVDDVKQTIMLVAMESEE